MYDECAREKIPEEKMSERRREEVTGEWRKLPNEELHDL
jgi:hypothetical protein